MIRFAIFLAFLLSFSMSYGQGPINIGIKFGTNRSTMITNFDDVLNQNIIYEDVNNYLAGAFARISLGRLYLQPEAYFNTKGGIIKPYGSDQSPDPSTTSISYQTIDLPVLIGIKLINKSLVNLRVYGGPVFTYVTANSMVSELSDFNVEDLNNRYMGWQIGAGFDFWFLTFDASIENSSNIIAPESDYQARNRIYLISAGIKLF